MNTNEITFAAVVAGLILDAPGQGLGLCSFEGPFGGSAVSPNLNITIEVGATSAVLH